MRIASRPPLRRLAALDRMIRAAEYPNARSAASQLEVHARTVHRDLEFLRDSLGAPLEFCHRHNGYYYRDPSFALPTVSLSEGELVALFLAERLMAQYRGTPYAKDLATAFRKLTLALPDTVTISLSHLDDAISFRSATRAGDITLFRRLARAVRDCRQLELVYWTASRDDTCQRVVDPYHLASVEGEWYLVAYCHLREDVRMFVPSRIRSAKETGDCFQRPTDFSIARYLDPAFRAFRGSGASYRVRLRFAACIAPYIREKTWHPGQQVQEHKDGSLTMILPVGHLLEVKRWALSFGDDCDVLEPEELRAEIRVELEQMMQHYR